MSIKANRGIRRYINGQNNEWDGTIVKRGGSATVSGNPLYCWVQKDNGGQPIAIYNDGVPHQAGRRVRVGADLRDRRLRVMRGAFFSGGDQRINPNVGQHASSHYENGPDPVFVTTKQVVNALVYPSTGMVIVVNPGWVVVLDKPTFIPLTSVDLTSHIPATGARYSLVRADGAGAISIQNGTPVASVLDLTNDDIPACEAGYVVMAVIRLYTGQTAISKQVAAPDIYDMRLSARSSGGVGSAAISRYSAAGVLQAVYLPSAAGLTAALAAAASGDLVTLPIGLQVTDNLTIPDGVNLTGVEWGRAQITGQVTCLGTSYLKHLDVIFIGDLDGDTAVRSTGADSFVQLTQCEIQITAPEGATCNAFGLEGTNAKAQMWRCYLHSGYGDGIARALYFSLSGTQELSFLASVVYAMDVANDYTALYTYASQLPPGSNYGTPLYGDRAAENHTHAMVPHNDTHEDGGSDEIDVTGLSGLLADPQDAGSIGGKAVDLTGLADGYVLIYNQTGDKFVVSLGGGGANLEDLGDVQLIEPYAGTFIGWDHTLGDGKWSNMPIDHDTQLAGLLGNGTYHLSLTERNDLIAHLVATTSAHGGIREKLTAVRTYYVRTDGNDSNTGLVDSAGGAFLTIQKAVDTVATLDMNGYAITIQVRDGTYTGATLLRNVIGFASVGTLVIQGNSGSPGNVIISTTSADCFNSYGLFAVWDIRDMRLQTTTSGYGLSALFGSTLRFANLVFGACASGHMAANYNANIVAIGNYSIAGGGTFHAYCNGSKVVIQNRTVTFLANVSITYFAYAQLLGSIVINGNTYTEAPYTCTGTEYAVASNSVIFVNGAGAGYLPGTSGGSPSTGGQYV